MLPAVDALSSEQAEVLALARRLGTLRRCAASLHAGERVPLVVSSTIYAYRRDAGDGLPALALFSKATTRTDVPLPAGAAPSGAYVDVVSGERIELAEGGSIALDPLTFKILIPATSPCHESTGALP